MLNYRIEGAGAEFPPKGFSFNLGEMRANGRVGFGPGDTFKLLHEGEELLVLKCSLNEGQNEEREATLAAPSGCTARFYARFNDLKDIDLDAEMRRVGEGDILIAWGREEEDVARLTVRASFVDFFGLRSGWGCEFLQLPTEEGQAQTMMRVSFVEQQ